MDFQINQVEKKQLLNFELIFSTLDNIFVYRG